MSTPRRGKAAGKARGGSAGGGRERVTGERRGGRSTGERRNAGLSRGSREGQGERRASGGHPGAAARPGTGRDERPLAPPESADPALLDRSVRAELRSLSKPNAEAVARHLVAAGELLDTDPPRALAHARAARARAARVAAVREAVGIAAYRSGEWAEALTELRAARRISGDPSTLPLIADAERALGRPAQAARILSDPDVRRLDGPTRAELLIVVAGARRDLGQLDAALSVLARGGLDRDKPRPGAARLWYAYADLLEAMGRKGEAAAWFAASAAQDPEGELDSAERAAALL